MSTTPDRIEKLSPRQRALYELLLRKKREEAATREMRPVSREGNALPLSFAQQRLYFIAEFNSDSPVYNVPSPVLLRGQLNVGALKRSLSEIVRRHESLLDQDVSQRLPGCPGERQALLELFLADQAGAQQQVAETRPRLRRCRQGIVGRRVQGGSCIGSRRVLRATRWRYLFD